MDQKSYVDGFRDGLEAAAQFVASMDNPWQPNDTGNLLFIADLIRARNRSLDKGIESIIQPRKEA